MTGTHADPDRHRTPGHDRSGRGQATVELALGLPVVVIGLLLVLQVALVGRDLLLVTHAAREGARTAAVETGRDQVARAAVDASHGLDQRRTEVRTERSGGRATVTVRYRAVTGLPLVGRLLPDPTLTATATMREEPR